MAQVNIYEAKTHLSKLVSRALAGEEIVVARAGKPLVRLVPVEGAVRKRRPGTLSDAVRIAADFDEPLPPDVLDAFHDGAPFPGDDDSGDDG